MHLVHFTLCLVEQNIWVFELVQPESKPRLDEIDQTTKHAFRFRFPENVILADTPIVPKWMYIKFPQPIRVGLQRGFRYFATMASPILTLRVTPRADRTEVVGRRADGVIAIRVTAAPADGKANAAVIKALADAIGTRPSGLTLVSGHTGRDKRVQVDSLTPDELTSALERLTRIGE